MLSGAIGEQRGLLARDPLSVDPYRALYRLYLQEQCYDQAWCMASASSTMTRASSAVRAPAPEVPARGA